jgi:hypothetical protein
MQWLGKLTALCVRKSQSASGNHTLFVEIALCTLVSVEIAVVTVIITIVRVSHTWLGLNPQIGRPLSRIVMPLVCFFLRVKITVVSVVITFVRFKITLRVEITLCVYKSHYACRNHTRTC